MTSCDILLLYSTNGVQAEERINELQTHIVSGGKHLTHSISSIASGKLILVAGGPTLHCYYVCGLYY